MFGQVDFGECIGDFLSTELHVLRKRHFSLLFPCYFPGQRSRR